MSASPESAFERLPSLIAEAITERGFTALTPVQERVLDPALEGVDLRISSQTGSGKTVALGLLLAPALAPLGLAERGEGRSRRAAEQQAARRMLEGLKASDRPGSPLRS